MPQRPPSRPAARSRTGSSSQPPTGGRPLTKKQRRRQAGSGPGKAPRPWWQSPYTLGGGTAALVAVIVVIAVLVFNNSSAAYAVSTPTAVPASVITAVTAPGVSLFGSVGEGGQSGRLSRLTGSKPVKDTAGLPEVVYVGAEYCPYCAAERWSMIMALARFGTFSNLKEMSSESNDIDPNTSSFTFVDSSYSSQYVDFSATETEDRAGNQLQTPSTQVEQVYSTYDQSPYTQSNGLPFLDIGGVFVLYETSYDPALLQGLTWTQIAADLGSPSNSVTQAIVGNANYLAAAICIADGNQPSSVCGSATIQSLETVLNAQSTIGS